MLRFPPRRRAALGALAVAGIGLAAGASSGVGAAPPARYYLALGDSLAQGVQPNAQGSSLETNQGYPDQLYATLRKQIPGLVLVKLGCPGDTTTSMRTGRGNEAGARRDHCNRTGGSQLVAAERFLKAHHRKGQVALVTLDIGANDVDGCTGPGVNTIPCVSAGLKTIKDNTPPILAGIRAAAPAGTRLAAMNLYDPLLGGYFSSSSRDKSFASLSVTLARGVNGEIESADKKGGFVTADVAGAFSTYDNAATVTFGGTKIPMNVSRVCSWTWACTTPPSGPNIHANKNGYAVISAAFTKALGRVR